MVYLDQANNQENNNTLYNAFLQYDFVNSWNDSDVQSKLAEAIVNVYSNIEQGSLDAKLAVINTYWSLLPEELIEYDGSMVLTAGQIASILVRANEQVPAGNNKEYTYDYYFNQVKDAMYIKGHSIENNLTKAEYLYTLSKNHLPKEFKGLGITNSDNRAEELSKALENLDTFTIPNDLKQVMDLCLDKGIISDSEYDNWDEAVTLNDAIDLYIRVLEKTDMYGSLGKPAEDTKGGLIEEETTEVESSSAVIEETSSLIEEETTTVPIEKETVPVVEETTTPVETTTSKPVETTTSKPVETTKPIETTKVEEETTPQAMIEFSKVNKFTVEEYEELVEDVMNTLIDTLPEDRATPTREEVESFIASECSKSTKFDTSNAKRVKGLFLGWRLKNEGTYMAPGGVSVGETREGYGDLSGFDNSGIVLG